MEDLVDSPLSVIISCIESHKNAAGLTEKKGASWLSSPGENTPARAVKSLWNIGSNACVILQPVDCLKALGATGGFRLSESSSRWTGTRRPSSEASSPFRVILVTGQSLCCWCWSRKWQIFFDRNVGQLGYVFSFLQCWVKKTTFCSIQVFWFFFFLKESESSLKSADDHSDNGGERRALTRPDRARRGPYVTKRFFSSEQRWFWDEDWGCSAQAVTGSSEHRFFWHI